MDVKTLIVKASNDLFEKRVKEFLEQGYKLQTSNIVIDEQLNKNIGVMSSLTKQPLQVYFYALFIKE